MGVTVTVFAVRAVEPNSEGVPSMTMRHKLGTYDREISAEEKSELRKKFIFNDQDYLEYEIERT